MTEEKKPAEDLQEKLDKALEALAVSDADKASLLEKLAAASTEALIATGVADRTLLAEVLEPEENQLVQFLDSYAFAGKKGPHRRIQLLSAFSVQEGQIVNLPKSIAARLERERPTLIETNTKKFTAQHRWKRQRNAENRWEAIETVVEVNELIKNAQIVGQMKIN